MNTADLLVAALREADLKTGDAQARIGNVELTDRYVVVWPSNEPSPNGPVGSPNADRTVNVQITSCGPSRKAADQVAEQARTIALGLHRGDPPDGYAWQQAPQHLGGQPTMREASVDPTAPDASGWYRADIYRYTITPTGVALP